MWHRAAARLVALAVVLLAAGCATQRLVPLPDGGVVDAARGSVTQARDGVTVTVSEGAWIGSPPDLTLYVLPLHAAVRNDTGVGVTVAPQDIVLLDDEGRQYNAIPPVEVAQMIQTTAAAWPTPVFAPWPYRYSIASPYLFDPFYHPFGPWWWYPPLRYQPGHDIVGLALQSGGVRPGARLEGFVYFPPPSRSARHFELVVGYRVDGERDRRELRFPFALERARD